MSENWQTQTNEVNVFLFIPRVKSFFSIVPCNVSPCARIANTYKLSLTVLSVRNVPQNPHVHDVRSKR